MHNTFAYYVSAYTNKLIEQHLYTYFFCKIITNVNLITEYNKIYKINNDEHHIIAGA